MAHKQVQGKTGDDLHHADDRSALCIAEAEIPAAFRVVVGETDLIDDPVQNDAGNAVVHVWNRDDGIIHAAPSLSVLCWWPESNRLRRGGKDDEKAQRVTVHHQHIGPAAR